MTRKNLNSRKLLLGLLFLTFLAPLAAYAQENASDLPRFASLSSEKVYLRAGPGKQYPIKWIYQRQGYPVKIVREFEHWRKIEDREGHSGWVYKGLLSGKRTGLVEGENAEQSIWLTRYDESDAQKIARIEQGAILFLRECSEDWCRGSAQGITGWIPRKFLWGIAETEIIE